MMTFVIDGMMCANCSRVFEEKASHLPGVDEIHVNYGMGKIKVKINHDFDKKDVVRELKNLCSQIEPKARLVEEANNTRKSSFLKEYQREIFEISLSLVFLVFGILYRGNNTLRLILFLFAYTLVAKDVISSAFSNIKKGEIFDENFLMLVATIGAFAIGEYPEGVAVMLFYGVGELFQDVAVQKSRSSIKELMDIRPDYANLKTLTSVEKVNPQTVNIHDIIVVKPGEKVPLDGKIIRGEAQFDTANLTGESIPRLLKEGEKVLSGYVNKNAPVDIQVEKLFKDSTASKILDLVENASAKKAKTERFITKFAKYYTPAVVGFAAFLAFVPPLFTGMNFSNWIYRALVFLVVSCPCALVVSIPLGFFGGIGAASKHGILVKGGNYLEALQKAQVVVFDKTGTLTEGRFSVNEISPAEGIDPQELVELAAYAEYYSNHPIALSIQKEYTKQINEKSIESYEEIQGKGVSVQIKGSRVLAGNDKLMNLHGITAYEHSQGTVVHIAKDATYMGSLYIYDKIKEDAKEAVAALKGLSIEKVVMLTGDNEITARAVAEKIGLDAYHAGLLPDGKIEKLETILNNKTGTGTVLFTGDGINDAPVLARADVGIAMGGIGSDAAIEAADVVIMNDEPLKIATAIQIARKTIRVVWQNIYFTFAVKALVLVMGAFGIATMWEAVFADVGVALVAIINASRIRNY